MNSKVIISSAHFEPFGISVLEGMSLGNVPIVYRSFLSGPYIDIVKKDLYGLSYQNIGELADLVDKVFSNDNLFYRYSYLAYRRSLDFDIMNFKNKFLKIISKI